MAWRCRFLTARNDLFPHRSTTIVKHAVPSCKAKARDGHSTNASGAPLQPFIMAHLCGIRTGAWSRRALVRAYGWWHSAADRLVAGRAAGSA